MFDMASCTKVTGATSAVAQFYQRGQLNLSEHIIVLFEQAQFIYANAYII